MKKVFFSQPMSGYSDETITKQREDAVVRLKEVYEEIDYDPASFFTESDYTKEKELSTDDVETTRNRVGLFYFLRSIQNMVGKDVLVLLSGWDNSRGCVVEYFIARLFKLPILEETYDNEGNITYSNITPSTDGKALIYFIKFIHK